MQKKAGGGGMTDLNVKKKCMYVYLELFEKFASAAICCEKKGCFWFVFLLGKEEGSRPGWENFWTF